MARVHFLNVSNGDCHLIEHESGRLTMIDVNKAGIDETSRTINDRVLGNFHQKDNPTDPITYLANRGLTDIFRFVLTHPDMDHLGGIKKLFDGRKVYNFWDTANTKEIDPDTWDKCPYNKEDWDFYKKLKRNEVSGTTRHIYLSGDKNSFFNSDGNGGNGDSIEILAPTAEISKNANETKEWNDHSYVLLFTHQGFKILFAGDSDDTSWTHILDKHKEKIKDIDVLIAPHHGRDSNRDWAFLDVLKPKLVLIGNASSEHLNYDKYRKYGKLITNNQACDVILNINSNQEIDVYVTNKKFADKHEGSHYNEIIQGYYVGYVDKNAAMIIEKGQQNEAARLLALINSSDKQRSGSYFY